MNLLRCLRPLGFLAVWWIWGGIAVAAEPVFSGPQTGEKTSPFQVLELTGPALGKERTVAAKDEVRPVALVFVHTIERSLVPLLRVVDEYGALRKDRLQTELVFLAADRIQGEQRVKAAAQSLRLQSRVGLSLDGAEGPGNYGLNKECMMTVVVARDRVVTANFALVQPGIADAPKVLEALARACGDEQPPSVEELSRRQMARSGGGREGAMRGGERAGNGAGAGEKPKEKFPGAVPADDRLQGMLRSFIRPTNDAAAVDRILSEVKTYIQGNAELRRQAREGWIRVLHFGDRYGTEYSRKVGREFLEELKNDSTLPPGDGNVGAKPEAVKEKPDPK